MTIWSHSEGPRIQRHSEDVSALAGERVDADARELALLAELRALTAVSLPARELVYRERRVLADLMALNDREDRDHIELLQVGRALAGEFEALNKEMYLASKREAAEATTDSAAQEKKSHDQYSPPAVQMALFGDAA